MRRLTERCIVYVDHRFVSSCSAHPLYVAVLRCSAMFITDGPFKYGTYQVFQFGFDKGAGRDCGSVVAARILTDMRIPFRT